jgi:23S rRNA pseudouridine2457 synthase
MLIAFHKPYAVLCQFSAAPGKQTLADFIGIPAVYPAGRLDFDSEGLLLLTDDGQLQNAIAHPAVKLPKRYWAQVEGIPESAALEQLGRGVQIGADLTRPAEIRLIEEPEPLWPRNPPIRNRVHIPTRWLEITISEGKNRQVRRMTAAVGHPTLRLIRAAIGNLELTRLKLAPGEWMEIDKIQLGLGNRPSHTRQHNVSTDNKSMRYRK